MHTEFDVTEVNQMQVKHAKAVCVCVSCEWNNQLSCFS